MWCVRFIDQGNRAADCVDSVAQVAGLPIEDIAHLVGHANTRTTERVYRKELRPVLRRGAKAMDEWSLGDSNP
jgi:integrase